MSDNERDNNNSSDIDEVEDQLLSDVPRSRNEGSSSQTNGAQTGTKRKNRSDEGDHTKNALPKILDRLERLENLSFVQEQTLKNMNETVNMLRNNMSVGFDQTFSDQQDIANKIEEIYHNDQNQRNKLLDSIGDMFKSFASMSPVTFAPRAAIATPSASQSQQAHSQAQNSPSTSRPRSKSVSQAKSQSQPQSQQTQTQPQTQNDQEQAQPAPRSESQTQTQTKTQAQAQSETTGTQPESARKSKSTTQDEEYEYREINNDTDSVEDLVKRWFTSIAGKPSYKEMIEKYQQRWLENEGQKKRLKTKRWIIRAIEAHPADNYEESASYVEKIRLNKGWSATKLSEEIRKAIPTEKKKKGGEVERDELTWDDVKSAFE